VWLPLPQTTVACGDILATGPQSKHKTHSQHTKHDIFATQTKSTITWHIGIQTMSQSPQSGVQLVAVEASKARIDTKPDFALSANYAGPLIVLAWTAQTTTVIRCSLFREVVARVQAYVFRNTHQFLPGPASESVSHEWHSLQRGSALPRTESHTNPWNNSTQNCSSLGDGSGWTAAYRLKALTTAASTMK